jgi:xanthine dehydrogenase YagS FAD-binding subunit
MVVRAPGGERVIPAQDFFMPPSRDIERMTVLEPGEVLSSVRIPPTWAGASFHFEKVSDRNSWDFALASVAAAFRTDGVTIRDARIVCGGVQCVPRRLKAVERYLRGRARTPEGIEAAGALASKGAEPLAHNAYKISLVENLVKRAIRSTAA